MKKFLRTFLFLPIFILLDFTTWFIVEATKILVAYYQGDERIRQTAEKSLNACLKAIKDYLMLIPALWGAIRFLAGQTLRQYFPAR
jgi:hypothetical protein